LREKLNDLEAIEVLKIALDKEPSNSDIVKLYDEARV
jgi:TusA-related sulfurtransferase